MLFLPKPLSQFPATPQRDFAAETCRQLRDAGFEALWAGGCVRDMVLGTTPKDYDVATSATPQQVIQLFGKCLGYFSLDNLFFGQRVLPEECLL